MRRWKRYDLVPVWERFDGLRVHLGGLVGFPQPHGRPLAIAWDDPVWRDCRRREPKKRRALLLYVDRTYPVQGAS